jgi:transposase
MDETGWMVFVQVDGKKGHRWWLWVVVTKDTVVFLMRPSRSAEVPSQHLGEYAQGILSVDRYKAYICLAANSNGRIVLAFCWAHQRRDFVRVGEGYPRLAAWAQGWVDRIAELYRLNDQRLAVRDDPAAFAAQDLLLRQAISAMGEARDRELADPAIHPAQRKALVSLRVHWQGLCVFVDHPEIPMDNNEAERRHRNGVIGRKNYYGSGAVWSATMTAVCFTLMQTWLKNDINPHKALHAYFRTCADNGGKPPKDVEAFLPWRMSPEQKANLALPP